MRRAISLPVFVGAIMCVVHSAHGSETTVFDSPEVSLRFDNRYYDRAKIVVVPKVLGPATPAGSTGPKRLALELSHRPRSTWKGAGRYYFPSGSVIYVTPLFDASVRDFAAAYPSLHRNAQTLREILPLTRQEFYKRVERPATAPDRFFLPDEPFSNTGACLLAHYKRLAQPRSIGYRVLTYYRNSIAGYGATNAELHYQYQGLTADRRFFVTAQVGVRHDLLPDSIDDPRAASNETEAEQMAERRRINRWKEDSFFPPLPALDEMIGSLQIKL